MRMMQCACFVGAVAALSPLAERPVLRSQTPAGVVQEVYALLLDHFAVRTMMFEASQQAQVSPVRISFTDTLKILRCRIPECPRRRRARSKWWRDLVKEVAEEVLPPRRNRVNPRGALHSDFELSPKNRSVNGLG